MSHGNQRVGLFEFPMFGVGLSDADLALRMAQVKPHSSHTRGGLMARYTCFFTLGIAVDQLHAAMQPVLEACNFNVLYTTHEYIMARENPGGVTFPKLVTAEVLIDRTTATAETVTMKFVLKNEELPLNANNHCQQVFQQLNQAVTDGSQWKFIELVAAE
jgi:hypothetical protein